MSTSFTQLNPCIPLNTEKGMGEAIAVIDYSQKHDLVWVVILDDTGEIWCIPNNKVRGIKNYTIGRNLIKEEK
jgi:hypothetical protein